MDGFSSLLGGVVGTLRGWGSWWLLAIAVAFPTVILVAAWSKPAIAAEPPSEAPQGIASKPASGLACRPPSAQAAAANRCSVPDRHVADFLSIEFLIPEPARCTTAREVDELAASIKDALACRTQQLEEGGGASCGAVTPPPCGGEARNRIVELVAPESASSGRATWSPEAVMCQSAIARGASLFVEKRLAERQQGKRRAISDKLMRAVAQGCREANVEESAGERLPRVGGACARLLGGPGTPVDGNRLESCLRAALEGVIDDVAPEALRPNIVLVLTDDQRWDTLSYMPSVQTLAAQGITFANAFATTPVCAPSRASLFSGLYAHHHGLWRAKPTQFDPASSFAPRLQASGYATGLFGKYLNGAQVLGETVPPGWSEWQIMLGGAGGDYTGFRLNENGVFRSFDESVYSTDYLADRAVDFIREHAAEPFLLVFAPFAPHVPADPAKRHEGRFAELAPWRPPSWHEEDVSQKPTWVKLLKAQTTDKTTEKRDELRIRELETLLSVDEAVGRISQVLERAGLTDDTLVIYTSDHGIHWGEHWSGTKFTAYEESIRVPLVMRYPARIPAGQVRDELVLILDLAPTILELAGVGIPPGLDGTSLVPLFDQRGLAWREDFLIENPGEIITAASEAVRTRRWKYIETWKPTGVTRELYDLSSDPHELDNLAVDPAHDGLRDSLAARLQELRDMESSKIVRPSLEPKPKPKPKSPGAPGNRKARLERFLEKRSKLPGDQPTPAP